MVQNVNQKIKESMILDANEPILSLTQVSDYLKYVQQYKKVVKDETAAALLTPNKNFYLFASSKKWTIFGFVFGFLFSNRFLFCCV